MAIEDPSASVRLARDDPVAGELDLATSPQLRDALREAEVRASRIVLDLRELGFMDSSGVHLIVDASNRARQSGSRLVLVRGPSNVDLLFTLTGTAADLDVVDTHWSGPVRGGGFVRCA